MGGLFGGTPKSTVDPELEEQRAKEKARLEQEKKDREAKKADDARKKRQNLVGARSLQDEELKGFGGYRQMGKTSGSIRE